MTMFDDYINAADSILNKIENTKTVSTVLVNVPKWKFDAVQSNGSWLSPNRHKEYLISTVRSVAKLLHHLVEPNGQMFVFGADFPSSQWVDIPEELVKPKSNKKSPMMPMGQKKIDLDLAAKIAVLFALGVDYNPDDSTNDFIVHRVDQVNNGIATIPITGMDDPTIIFIVSGKTLNTLKVEGWGDQYTNWDIQDDTMNIAVDQLKPPSRILAKRNNHDDLQAFTLYPAQVALSFIENGWSCFDLKGELIKPRYGFVANGTGFKQPTVIEIDFQHAAYNIKTPMLVVDLEKGIAEYRNMD